jgi:hypothetical protein
MRSIIVILFVCLVIGMGALFLINVQSSIDDSKFVYLPPSDTCPGVPQLNWLNDTTIQQSIVYTQWCIFPSGREQQEGCIDWHATRINFEARCKELQLGVVNA